MWNQIWKKWLLWFSFGIALGVCVIFATPALAKLLGPQSTAYLLVGFAIFMSIVLSLIVAGFSGFGFRRMAGSWSAEIPRPAGLLPTRRTRLGGLLTGYSVAWFLAWFLARLVLENEILNRAN